MVRGRQFAARPGRIPGRRGCRRGAAGPAACAGPGARHARRRAAGGALAPSHGPRAAGPRTRRSPHAGELPAEAIESLVAAAGSESGSPCSRSSCDSSAARSGGPTEMAGPSTRFPANSRCSPSESRPIPSSPPQTEGHLPVVIDAMSPWDAGNLYGGFTERTVDVGKLYSADARRRLGEVKAAYDPTASSAATTTSRPPRPGRIRPRRRAGGRAGATARPGCRRAPRARRPPRRSRRGPAGWGSGREEARPRAEARPGNGR